jgi:hypothetical protein
VIESDADLALLTTGIGQYPRVLVTPGTHNATAPIDLEAHGVITFVGCDRNNSILNVGFCISHTGANGYFLKIGQNTRELGDFSIVSNVTQYDTTVNVNNDVYIIYCPLYSQYPTTNIHDITIDSPMFAYENTSGTPTPWTRVFAMKGANAGFDGAIGRKVGFDGSVTNCYFANLWFGIMYFSNIESCKFSSVSSSITECINITSCTITGSDSSSHGISNSYSVSGCTVYNTNSYGFSSCYGVTGCRAITTSSKGTGFHLCQEISACYSTGYSNGFGMCDHMSACSVYYAATYGFDACQYVSSSYVGYAPTKWFDCTKVDSDSCNNV